MTPHQEAIENIRDSLRKELAKRPRDRVKVIMLLDTLRVLRRHWRVGA